MADEGSDNPINNNIVKPLMQFSKNSIALVQACNKPDTKEFSRIAIATGVGFLIMGFIGFVVKLIHIPINQILLSQ